MSFDTVVLIRIVNCRCSVNPVSALSCASRLLIGCTPRSSPLVPRHENVHHSSQTSAVSSQLLKTGFYSISRSTLSMSH